MRSRKNAGRPPAGGRPAPGRYAFTLVELLVTVGLLLALTMMASGTYMGFVKSGEEGIVRNNLSVMRSALQQFYADNGRYPFHGKDIYGNDVGFLDDATSELVQGPHKDAGKYPASRARYLGEIPIDPSTNAKNWVLVTEPFKITPSATERSVVTNVKSVNPLFRDL